MSRDSEFTNGTISDREAREASKAEAQLAIDAATAEFARGGIDRGEWQRRVSDALGEAYLRWDDPRWQSGFDGDATRWHEARSLILDAVPRNGRFLDVGCANGYLLESLDEWARGRGVELELHGLEINAGLAAEARRRLPALADHIHVGNISDWTPDRRFTYVRTGLEYVPPGAESSLVRRVMRDLVEPNGRIIVGPVGESEVESTKRAFADADVSDPSVAAKTDRDGKTRSVVWAATSAKTR